jgi:ABC-type uncharacterized transport system substrate-binding protein
MEQYRSDDTINLAMMISEKKRFLAFIFLLFASSFTVAGHPHIFIDAAVDFHFDSEKLTGIQVYWLFDEFFTASIVQGFDTNGDKKFSNDEIQSIRDNAFQNLRNYDYFTFFKSVNGSESAKEALYFKAALSEDGRLLYTFFVPFTLAFNQHEQSLTISMYDPTFYADVYFPENDYAKVIEEGNLAYTLESGINENKTYSAYQANPYEVIIGFKRK